MNVGHFGLGRGGAVLLLAYFALAPARGTEPVRFSSGTARVSLIELYTSEGCSSCPPAERWLGALRGSAGLWREFVPISFHVDYWNGQGWRDRLSSPAFTQRQYAYAREGGLGSIYTPCFVVDGREWQPRTALPKPEGKPGVLTVELSEAGICRVAFVAARKWAHLQAHAALLGGGLWSQVTGGENSGRTLRHEFVAMALAERRLALEAASGEFTAEFALAKLNQADAPTRALAAWVTQGDDHAPLQAVGGWISR